MKLQIRIFCVLLFITGILFSGCVSNKKYCDYSFGVLVVDENDFSVPDFTIAVRASEKKGAGIAEKTDSQGMCFFQNSPKQKIHLVGTKNGYTKIDEIVFRKKNGKEILCFKTQCSDYVLQAVLNFYIDGEYMQGLDLLDSLYFDKKTKEYFTVVFYKAVGKLLAGQEEKVLEEIQILKDSGIDESKEYIRELENLFRR